MNLTTKEMRDCIRTIQEQYTDGRVAYHMDFLEWMFIRAYRLGELAGLKQAGVRVEIKELSVADDLAKIRNSLKTPDNSATKRKVEW
jgi:hypothetical protein